MEYPPIQITNTLCPKCLIQNYDAKRVNKCQCGYIFTLDFIIPYGFKWDYSEELLPKLKKNNGLYLSGTFVGKSPEKLKEL